MDSKKKTNKIGKRVGVIVSALILGAGLWWAGPHLWLAGISAKHFFMGIKAPSAMKSVAEAMQSIQEKADAIRHAETDNARLRLENVNLKLQVENLQFNCRMRESAELTQEIGLKLTHEAGSRLVRTLESIQYRPPAQLLPPQLYTMAVTYFKAREDEKAAVILSQLIALEDNPAFKTEKNFLMTGVAWYRLEHLELAENYFERVLNNVQNVKEDSLMLKAQARLWRALVAHKMNKPVKVQYWLLDLLDHHPHSPEVGWVNYSRNMKAKSEEVNRAPASAPHETGNHH